MEYNKWAEINRGRSNNDCGRIRQTIYCWS